MTNFNPETDLKLERVVDIAPDLIWKAWTQPEHLTPWFCPLPWKTIDCRIDLKPGGGFYTLMQGPQGEEHGGECCYLEVVPERLLVWTSALMSGYRPGQSEMPFTAFIILESLDEGSRYRVILKHKNSEDKTRHEEMGFQQGWSAALDQLVTYMKGL